jgi:hypothetical protein
VLAAAVLFAGQWDVAATATTESRAGETLILDPAGQMMNPMNQAPTNSSSRGFAAQIVRPIADVAFKSPDTTLRFEYGPRILWQTPRPVGDRALILHMANLSVSTRTDKSVSFTGSATGSIGQPDYSTLLLSFGTTTTSGQTQQLASITNIATGTVQATTSVRLSPTVSGVAGVRVFRFQILNDIETMAMMANPATSLITSQTIVGFDPGVTVKLNPLNTLSFESSVSGAWYSNGLTYLTVTPNAVWTARLDQYSTLRMQLGMSHARPIEQPKATTGMTGQPLRREPVTAPIGLVGIDSVLSRREGVVFRVAGESGGNVVFDPILGRADPRVMVRASASLTVVPDWMFAVRGDFATSVDPPPVIAATDANGDPVNDANGNPIRSVPIVTNYSVTASARKLVSSNVVVELGAFLSDRGPALNTADFAFVQPSRWVYLMLTVSTRAMSRFAQ